MNIILQTDSYKPSQWRVYNPEITNLYSYMESRGGEFKKTVFILLQYILKKDFVGQVVTREKIDEAEQFFAEHFGRTDVFNKEGWEYILKEHGGKLPISIRAVPEGTIVPYKNILLDIENTDEKCAWLVNYMETILMKLWYPICMATRSYEIRQTILKHLVKSGTPESIDFKCHDFGYRGCTSEEHAAIGSAAHLFSFKGTDTLAGIVLLKKYYNSGMCGFSIPATEHSVKGSYGRTNNTEVRTLDNLLTAYPDGLVADVGDTYDIYNYVSTIIGEIFKDRILARNGTLVVRPDSGDFFEVNPRIQETLYHKIGGKVNDKKFKVLDPHVGTIQGDGMNPVTIDQLYTCIEDKGWSSDNMGVGSGGGLLVEGMTRDLNKFAIKASAAKVNGVYIDLYKDPITDKGKLSKKGKLKLVNSVSGYITVRQDDPAYLNEPDILREVLRNGELLIDEKFDDVRTRLHNQ